MIQVYIDACARPNPGKGGVGITIRGNGWDYILSEKVDSKDKVSNNEAEYCALNRALVELMRNKVVNDEIVIYSDSELLVLQMTGEKSIDKGGKYVEAYLKAKQLSKYFSNLRFNWISRDENAEANLLASRAVKNDKI